MSYLPLTSFRRAIDAVVLENIRTADAPLPALSVNKWEVLRQLCTAKEAFGLTDRPLTVLQALLSFYPEQDLSPDGKSMIVFPSNAAICARLNGMPCSTMRRHLARLVDTGMIVRRDSPNGKRYTRRRRTGTQAFGFDLSPLLRRFEEITAKADEIQRQAERTRQARQAASLMCRDLTALAAYGKTIQPDCPLWDQLSDLACLTARRLRRKLTPEELQETHVDLEKAVVQAKAKLDVETAHVSTNDAQNEQHHQNSNKEKDIKKNRSKPQKNVTRDTVHSKQSTIPLTLVLDHCRETQNLSLEPIRDWTGFIRAIEKIRPMMGITNDVWHEAEKAMGLQQAASVLGAMLERFSDLKSPNAYLRYLSRKAEADCFSCIPMIVALGSRTPV